MKVLWISPQAPYEKVSHAGGQTHNFYLKKLVEQKEIDVDLISFCFPNEYSSVLEYIKKLDIRSFITCWDNSINSHNIIHRIDKFIGLKTSHHKYAGMSNRGNLMRIKKGIEHFGTNYDVVILHWTQIGLFLPDIKNKFKTTRFIIIEEDVAFLSYYRRMADGLISQSKYNRLKKMELSCLKQADCVIINNFKDLELVKKNGVNNTFLWSVFFNDLSMYKTSLNPKANKVIFFGAMSRPENYKSAIWFIEKVMPKFKEKIEFLVVGSNPDQSLYNYESPSVKITGFVEDVGEYFQNALCFVAPLVLGAGVKVKVLEALSSGIPVLTNAIGIEGIPAVDNRDYLFCQDPEDYYINIMKLTKNMSLRTFLGENGRKLIRDNYDLENNANNFIELVRRI